MKQAECKVSRAFKTIQLLQDNLSVSSLVCSVTQWCPTLCDYPDCRMPGFPVLHRLTEFAHTHDHWVGDAIQPSHPLSSLLFLPSVFPSIRVFSNESALHIRWPKYWKFSFNISPSNEYSGLISFRMDWFDLLVIPIHLFFKSHVIVLTYSICLSLTYFT